MFLCVVLSPPPDRHALARHVRAMHDRDRDSQDDVGWLLVSGQ